MSNQSPIQGEHPILLNYFSTKMLAASCVNGAAARRNILQNVRSCSRHRERGIRPSTSKATSGSAGGSSRAADWLKKRTGCAASRIRSRPSTTSASSPAAFTSTESLQQLSSSTAGRKARNILPLELVQSPSVKLVLPILGNAGYMALASGFLMTDMLALRLALVGGYSGLVAFHLLHARPLRIPLRWSAFFVVVNAGAACLLIADQWSVTLTEDAEELYKKHFPMLTRGEFAQLLSLGTTRKDLPHGTRLTVEGVHSDKIYFLKRGHSKLYLRDKYTADCDEGSFVNDVAFIQGDDAGAYGTVVSEGATEVIEWDWEALRDHLASRPDMDRNMKYCFTQHLVKGLMQQREAAHLRNADWNMDRKEASTTMMLDACD